MSVGRSDSPAPSVTVVIVNLDGAAFLPECLDSLAEQDYPSEAVTVLVVDNGSTDGSVNLLRTRDPSVRVLAQPKNIGFAPAVNVGARESTSECLVFINNDARVDRRFLSEMVGAYSPVDRVLAVGGRIVSWDGAELDFFEGGTGLDGMASQIGYGSPARLTDAAESEELLFACGGAMLIGRDAFLDIGGFDDRFFAYFEDVDLGWRMHLLGLRVVAAPRAVAYHRMHGTSSRFPFHKRVYLYERNALLCLIKNIDHRNLSDVLLAAVLLAVTRTAVRGELSPRLFDIRNTDRSVDNMSLPMTALAPVAGIVDVLDDLDDILAARADVQSRRVMSDEEILPLLARTFWPAMTDRGYLQIQERLVTWLRLDRVAPRRRAGRVLVVLPRDDIEGIFGVPQMGVDDKGEVLESATRLKALAEAISTAAHTTVVGSVEQVESIISRRDLAVAIRGGVDALRCLAEAADVVVTGAAPGDLEVVALTSVVRVVDFGSTRPPEANSSELASHSTRDFEEVLDFGDLFLCCSGRDFERWTSYLKATGRSSQGVGGLPAGEEMLLGVWDGIEGSEPAPVLAVVRQPWLWTEARHVGHPRLPTDEVRALMDERNRLYGYLSRSTLSADHRWRRRVGVGLAHLLDGNAPVLAEQARMSLGLGRTEPWRNVLHSRMRRVLRPDSAVHPGY